MPKNALIIFVKNPVLGKVKTRLAATLGHKMALEIYLKLISLTLEAVKNVQADRFIFFSDEVNESIGNELLFKKLTQKGKDLGQRMNNAFEAIFELNYQNIAIIGTDCPGISAGIIEQAFEALENHAIAIGPAQDGGYYLLAMKEGFREIFEGIEWSTDTVFASTIQICEQHKKSVKVLVELNDVDEEKDLADWNPRI
jgi:uncharacterized protein